MMFRGIDISHWNGDIDFSKVAQSQNFVIIKAGGSDKGFYKDKRFEEYYAQAKENGINVGAYYYVGSKCISYNDGVADAERFLNIVKGKQFEYPLYIDLESTDPKDKAGATEACIGFCRTLESHGYFAGIYASDLSGFMDRLNSDLLTPFSKWVARYGNTVQYMKNHAIWQFSSKGAVDGIKGNVDLDISYLNFPDIMKKKHLNGF